MPVRKVWDHAIDLNEDFKASKAKVYPLSRNKREEVQKFVEEHLKKKYIRPSKSQQTSPVFFVGKKDGGKRMVMDYHRLNKQTVKNNYPLPLITELVDNMGSRRVFTKMDLRWGYNNVRIKKGCYKLHSDVSPRIMGLFRRSKLHWKALKKTFPMMLESP